MDHSNRKFSTTKFSLTSGETQFTLIKDALRTTNFPFDSRSLPGHETYAVLLNLETSEVTVDLTKLTKNFGEKVVVVTAGAKSSFNIG